MFEEKTTIVILSIITIATATFSFFMINKAADKIIELQKENNALIEYKAEEKERLKAIISEKHLYFFDNSPSPLKRLSNRGGSFLIEKHTQLEWEEVSDNHIVFLNGDSLSLNRNPDNEY